MNDLFAQRTDAPKGLNLAERLRPRAIDQVIGQAQILAADAPLGAMLGNKQLSYSFLGTTRCWQTTLRACLRITLICICPDQRNFHGCPRFEKGV